ncbi:MAG: hypothetical protein N3D11_07745 [Candidatus Sumerlaeia bacterium]|nr:hypothetical protein [Candidatus Sumerlaeia bacterium]
MKSTNVRRRCAVGFALMLLAALSGRPWAAETAPTAPAGNTSALPVASPALVGTTVPVAPSVFVGGEQPKPAPPPVRPDFRTAPPSEGTVTFLGKLPKDTKVSIPPFRAFGKGEIELHGEGTADVSGEGMLWADTASSVALDAATTFTRTAQGDGILFDKFRGTARVSGFPFHLRLKGDRLRIMATGKGKATMSGELGMYTAIDANGHLVSGVWKGNPVMQAFAPVEESAPAKNKPDLTISSRPEVGSLELLPAVLPAVKVTTPRPLPSSGGAATAPPAAPAAPAATPAAPAAPPAATPAQPAAPAAPAQPGQPAPTPTPTSGAPEATPASPPPAPGK